MIMVGFEGLSVTPDVRMMIEKYYVGNIILTRRNIQGMCLTPAPHLSDLNMILTLYRWRSISKSDTRAAEHRAIVGVSKATYHWNRPGEWNGIMALLKPGCHRDTRPVLT